MLGLPGYLLNNLSSLSHNSYLTLLFATNVDEMEQHGCKFGTCLSLLLKFFLTLKTDFLFIIGWFLGGLSDI